MSGVLVTSSSYNLTTVASSRVVDDVGVAAVDVAKVRYAYAAIGSLILVSSLLYVVAYLRGYSRRVEIVDNKKKLPVPPGVDIAKESSPEDGRSAHHSPDRLPISGPESAASEAVIASGLRDKYDAYILGLYCWLIVVESKQSVYSNILHQPRKTHFGSEDDSLSGRQLTSIFLSCHDHVSLQVAIDRFRSSGCGDGIAGLKQHARSTSSSFSLL